MGDDRIKELIELAKIKLPEDELKNKYAKQPVKRFMISDDMEEGSELIPAFLVYDRYLSWCETYNVQSVSTVVFFDELSLYCIKKRKGNGIFYGLSPKGFNLSPEYIELVRRKNDKKKKKRTKS